MNHGVRYCQTGRRSRPAGPPRAAGGALCASLLVLIGCQDAHERLITDYGHRRGSAAASVNGTTVLAEMFREAGGRPATVLALSSNLDSYDVIVWAPDNFQMPKEPVREFLEQWLKNKPGRTLVYIGRDYDATLDYWRAMIAQAPPLERERIQRRQSMARTAHRQARRQMPREAFCQWFVMRRDFPGRYVDVLNGPWSAAIDARACRIWSRGGLEIPTAAELNEFSNKNQDIYAPQPRYTRLLGSERETLAFRVSRSSWNDSRLLVVANGSFLLNLPLVNHQHRKLAGRLVDECRPFDKVAFLESGAGGPALLEKATPGDDNARRRRVLLAAHWFILGMVICFRVFPIFGRPRSPENQTAADFGEHIEAMATLLEHTGDTKYAERQLKSYHEGKQPK